MQGSRSWLSGAEGATVESRRSDAMAGGSGAAGSVPDVRHQPPGISGISHLFAVKTN